MDDRKEERAIPKGIVHVHRDRRMKKQTERGREFIISEEMTQVEWLQAMGM